MKHHQWFVRKNPFKGDLPMSKTNANVAAHVEIYKLASNFIHFSLSLKC